MTTMIAIWALTYLIHSTVLIGVAAIASRMTNAAAFRDVLWKVALIAAIFTASLQSYVPELSSVQLQAPAASVEAIPFAFPEVQPTMVLSPSELAVAPIPADAPPVSSVTILDVVIAGWFLVAIALLARVAFARRRLMKLLAPMTPVSDHEADVIVEQLRIEAGLAPVSLTESSATRSPFATHRQEICVPEGFLSQLNREQKQAILAHEIAHIARRDPQWLLLSEVVKAVFFFQPLNVMAQRQMRDASEFLCDDFAVVRTGMRRELAESLAGLAEVVRGSALPLSAMAEGRSRLVERVTRLLSDRKPELTLAPRYRVAIGLTLAAMMVFLAPVVAAVDRAVPQPAAEPTQVVEAEPVVAATRTAAPTPVVASAPAATAVAPAVAARVASPVAATIVDESHVATPAALASAPAGVATATPAIATIVTPGSLPTPAVARAVDATIAPRAAVSIAPPAAVSYSTGPEPYVSATSSRDGHYGEISLVQSDDHKKTTLEGRNVTIANHASKIEFSDKQGYLRVTQEWKTGERREVKVSPKGKTNEYVYRVNGKDQAWSAAAERVILDAFGNAPKKPVTPKAPAAAPAPQRSSAVSIPGSAKIAIAKFDGCEQSIGWDSRAAKSRTAGAPAFAVPEGLDSNQSSWSDYSAPRRMEFGRPEELSPCTDAGKRASEAYRRALGARAVTLKTPLALSQAQRRKKLVEMARKQGADYLLEGDVMRIEPGGKAVVVTVAIETRLIRVDDERVVETWRDSERGTKDDAYQTLARRLVAALGSSS